MKSEVGFSAGQLVRRLLEFLFLASVPGFALAQDPTLSFTAPEQPVVAGTSVSVWLNALNPSAQEISWTFPGKITCRIASASVSLENSLELRDGLAARAVAIAPGGFARREYLWRVPMSVTGQVVIAFSQLNANRVVLDAQRPAPVVASGPETKPKSPFQKLLNEVEPEELGKPFDPGRFFKEHISGYEPFYFLAGTKSPNTKFQISLKYQLLNSEGPLATHVPEFKRFHVAYTQTSLWDWNAPSAPFLDTSYKPEFLYSWDRFVGGRSTNWLQLDLQTAVKHESNGKDGANSRSVNIAYLRPTLTLGRDAGLQLTLQPRAWVYIGDLSDNPDIADYRGYVDLRVIAGWKRGLQLSALGRMGKDGNHESLQLDLTYPTMQFFGSFSVYLHAQYFTGYGESLLEYNRKSESFRIGFSLYR